MHDTVEALDSGVAQDPARSPSLLTIAVRRYQAGEMEPWAAVILEALADRLTTASRKLRPINGVADPEDMRQQLAVEVLDAARAIRLDAEEWIPRMLIERAVRNVRRWARRQTRLDCGHLRDDIPTPEQPGWCNGVPNLPSLAAAHVSGRDAELLYRSLVLGEPFSVIASRLGASSAALRSRASRATRRVRQQRTPEQQQPRLDNMHSEGLLDE